MKKIKLNKYEKRKIQEQRIKNNMSGSGLYVYENNTDGDLTLPKPTQNGIKTVGPRKRFEGDSYYMKWVGPPMNLLRLMEQLEQKAPQEKEKSMQEEKKLILDQPDIVNNKGKIEHVVDDQTQQQSLNDSTDPDNKKPDVLLNESPVDGVEIILG